jgi:hypothetical protein
MCIFKLANLEENCKKLSKNRMKRHSNFLRNKIECVFLQSVTV